MDAKLQELMERVNQIGRLLHTRAVTVYRDTLTRGFSHFVTSMTAPVASGWSGCRVGLTPTGKRRLVTAHTQLGHWVTGFDRIVRTAPRPIWRPLLDGRAIV